MNDLDEELVQDFLAECADHVDTIETALLGAEEDPSSFDVAGVFRAAHTIKGTAGFLGYANLGLLTHRAENLLGAIRDAEKLLDGNLTGLLLEVVDFARDIMASISDNGVEPDVDLGSIVERLEASLSGEPPDKDVAQTSDEPGPGVAQDVGTQESNQTADSGGDKAKPASNPKGGSVRIGELLESMGQVDHASVESALAAQKAGDRRPLGEILIDAGAVASESVAEAVTTLLAHGKDQKTSAPDEKIKVSVAHLDTLVNLVGELVLARNQVLQITGDGLDNLFSTARDRIDQVTTELQEATMTARMQPIGNAWSALPRVVRDLAGATGKKVKLELIGKETDLDKSLIEAIKGPITHIVRNAIDHGLELPDERRAADKEETGSLRLEAFHQDGQVHIKVSDDGRGMDPERIRKAAIAKHVMTAEQAQKLSEKELVELVMAPGFSTAEQVTDLSGRGVGMDVVKTSVEAIGGNVALSSRVGFGTEVNISIPLTLAIVPALTADVAGLRFAIPQQSIVELVRVPAADIPASIETVDTARFLNRRGRLLPLVDIAEVLQLARVGEAEDLAPVALNVAVLLANGQEFGLLLETIRETSEIVVKPLDRFLAHVDAFAGATILGSGALALILNSGGIARMAGVLDDKMGVDQAERAEVETNEVGTKMRLLLLDVEHRRYAIDLDQVDRIEKFSDDELEWSGDGRVVQYRGGLLRLVPLSRVVGATEEEPTSHVTVVVAKADEGLGTGFVAGHIVDVVEEWVVVHETPGETVAGSVVVRDRVTDLLDLTKAETQVAHLEVAG